MLSVILFILKIIGIALLVLLGILLFLMLIVLFVPIRYRVKVDHGEAFALDGGVSWFLHLIHARITQSGSKRRIWIRIMGILIYDSLRPPKNKGVRSKKNKRSKRNKSIEDVNHINSKDNTNHHKVSKIEKDESIIVEKPSNVDIEKDDIGKDNIKNDDIKSSSKNINDIKNSSINNNDIKNDYTLNDDIRINDIKNEDTANDSVESDEDRHGNKLIRTYEKVKSRIKGFFRGIWNRLTGIIKRLVNIKNKVSLILDFVNDDMNKLGFRSTYETIRKLLKHILPRKLRSKLIFGTGDPCSTGQILGVFAILYSFYGDSLQITPDFENKVFRGSHYGRGRIRIWTLLIIVIKLLLDKKFKNLKMNYQLLKEAL